MSTVSTTTAGSICFILLNVCLQHLDHFIGLFDGSLLLYCGVIAEHLVRCELHLLLVLLLLDHTIEKLNNFLNWRDFRLFSQNSSEHSEED